MWYLYNQNLFHLTPNCRECPQYQGITDIAQGWGDGLMADMGSNIVISQFISSII
jgi:hypothetical protein